MIVYHGSLTDFNEFDDEKSSPYSYLGACFYFSSEYYDSLEHYANPSSPDWRSKLDSLNDSKEEPIDSDSYEYLASQLIENYKPILYTIELDCEESDLLVFDENNKYWHSLYSFDPEDEDEVVYSKYGEEIMYIASSLNIQFDFCEFNLIEAITTINTNRYNYCDDEAELYQHFKLIQLLLEDTGYKGIIKYDVDKMWQWMCCSANHIMIFDKSLIKIVSKEEVGEASLN